MSKGSVALDLGNCGYKQYRCESNHEEDDNSTIFSGGLDYFSSVGLSKGSVTCNLGNYDLRQCNRLSTNKSDNRTIFPLTVFLKSVMLDIEALVIPNN